VKSTDNLALLLHIRDAVNKLAATRRAGRTRFVNSANAADATRQRLTSIAISVPRLMSAVRRLSPART
jgi:hypothetical protein